MQTVITLFVLFTVFLVNQAAIPDAPLLRKVILLNWASYCGNNGLTPEWDCFMCKMDGLKDFKFNAKVLNRGTVMFGFMGNVDDTIYLTFRGTVPVSLTSWIMNDLRFWRVPYPAIFGPNRTPKVHKGFKEAWESIQTEVFKMMSDARSYCPTCTKAIITGHSLGGAVAPFAALYASEKFGIPKENIQLITAAGPRVGNMDFAREVVDSVSEVFRLVNDADIVPHIPFQMWGYEHPPTEMWWRDGLGWKVCSRTQGEDPECSNSLPPYKFINSDHIHLADVVDGDLILKHMKEEQMVKWCTLTHGNGKGLLDNIFAVSDEETSPVTAEELQAVEDALTALTTIDTSAATQEQQEQQQSSGASGTVGVVVVVVVVVMAIIALALVVMAVMLARKIRQVERA